MSRLAVCAVLAALISVGGLAVKGWTQGVQQPEGFRARTRHQGESAADDAPVPAPAPPRAASVNVPARTATIAPAASSNPFSAAFFGEPTTGYKSMLFGGAEHPTAISVQMPHRLVTFQLPKDSVFEDRLVRLVDLDRDGVDEIVAVRSYFLKGSALTVLRYDDYKLELMAETLPTGMPFRWLNPVGFADFDGDGQIDIAVVETPHREGKLQIWSFADGKLEQIASADNVSNHVFGSTHLQLSVIADFNGDGRPDIAVPSADRRALRFLTLENGEIEELGEARLMAPATEDFMLETLRGKPAVRVGLSGGRSVVISPCRDVQGWEMADGSC